MMKTMRLRGKQVQGMVEQLNEMAEKYPPNVVGYVGYKFSWVPLWCVTLACICAMFVSGAAVIALIFGGEKYAYGGGLLSVLVIVGVCCGIVVFAFSVFGMFWGTIKMTVFQRPFIDSTEVGPFESDLKMLNEVHHKTCVKVLAYLAERTANVDNG